MKRLLPFVCVLVLVTAACSLGPREDWAKSIRGGFEVAADEGTALVNHSAKVEVIETTIRQEPSALIASATGVADFSERRARLVERAQRSAEVVFDDLKVYVQRSASSLGQSKERWASFDYEKEPDVELDDNDRRLAVGVGLISPVLALELLDGVLTGSIEQGGEGTKAGVQATRYTAKLAPDAAITKIDDEDRQEGVQRMFETLGVQEDNFPVEVWIDATDHVRAIRYKLRQQKDRVNAFELELNWEFPEQAPTARTIALPESDDTLRSGRFSDFVTEAIRNFD